MPKARVRHTCTECSLRRQQCDRRTPCGRCVSRGVPEKCQLNWQGGRYDPTKHRVYPSKQRQLRPLPNQSTPHRTSESLLGDGRDESSNLGMQSPSEIHASSCPAPHSSRAQPSSIAARPGYIFTPYEPAGLRKVVPDLAGAVSFYPLPPRTYSDQSRTVAVHEAFMQTLLPSADRIWKLVDYHEQYLLWYHCCYHGPTFRSELESVLAEQKDKTILEVSGLHLQWLALLFAIMTGSLTCTTEGRLQDWGFSKSETITLSKQWYKATVTSLNHGEWTSDHHIFSVQAITTLVISAHSLGCSSELSVLLGGALKVAQALELDRLSYDPELEQGEETPTNVQAHLLLKRDIGRKVWAQLCVQDWTSLPFTGSHSIYPAHFTSTLPSSRNYLTMEYISPTFPTYVSYGNYLFEIARLVVQHHEAMVRSTTPFTKYQHVLAYDAKMRDLATKGMPKYFYVMEPVEAVWPQWVHWARSSLTVCFAHKIIMIHRDYIRQSFTDPAYTVTRATCVAAAKTILYEANQASDRDSPIIWVDKASCVTAALILCLDMFHRSESNQLAANHQGLVLNCIEQLRTFDASVIAVRGSNLLQKILAERDRAPSELGWPPPGIDVSKLMRLVSTPPNDSHDADPDVLPRSSTKELFPPPTGLSNRFLFDILSIHV